LKTAVALTTENPAAGKTKIINCAFIACLITAFAGCHLFQIIDPDFIPKINHFGRGNEKPMAERLEIAAFPTGLAFACRFLMRRNLLIKPFIYFFHPPDYFLIAFHFSTTAGYF
jgi:hypothetical protein